MAAFGILCVCGSGGREGMLSGFLVLLKFLKHL